MSDPQIQTGGPAFPTSYSFGMSLRDYFAGQALAGILASESNPQLTAARLKSATNAGHQYELQLAREAYQLADALIAVRNA